MQTKAKVVFVKKNHSSERQSNPIENEEVGDNLIDRFKRMVAKQTQEESTYTPYIPHNLKEFPKDDAFKQPEIPNPYSKISNDKVELNLGAKPFIPPVAKPKLNLNVQATQFRPKKA